MQAPVALKKHYKEVQGSSRKSKTRVAGASYPCLAPSLSISQQAHCVTESTHLVRWPMSTRESLLADASEEAAELTQQALRAFMGYIEEFALGREEQLVRMLNMVTKPADMSTLLMYINKILSHKRNSIAKSQACLSIFVSWTQVRNILFPPSFHSACDADKSPCALWPAAFWSMIHCTGT